MVKGSLGARVLGCSGIRVEGPCVSPISCHALLVVPRGQNAISSSTTNMVGMATAFLRFYINYRINSHLSRLSNVNSPTCRCSGFLN